MLNPSKGDRQKDERRPSQTDQNALAQKLAEHIVQATIHPVSEMQTRLEHKTPQGQPEINELRGSKSAYLFAHNIQTVLYASLL